MPATWIDRGQRDEAIRLGHTVVEPAVVLATHLDTLIHRHAHELLGRQETQELLDHFKKSFPKLVEDVVPKVLPLAVLQQLLQLLLEEGVPIKDLRTILEVASEHMQKTPDALDALPHVRLSLKRMIVQKALGQVNAVRVLGVQPAFENLIEQAIGPGAKMAADGVIEPSLMKLLLQEVAEGIDELEAKNLPPVIVCGSRTRLTFSRIARRIRPQTVVLAHSELPPQMNITFERLLCKQAAA
jgi:flagellar biosynthesis protein FlhA